MPLFVVPLTAGLSEKAMGDQAFPSRLAETSIAAVRKPLSASPAVRREVPRCSRR